MGQVYRMKDKKRKKPIKLRSIIILLMAIYIIYTLAAQYITIRKARAEETRIQAQIEEVKEENQRLKEELEKMQSDEYIEKIARERLGLIKSGEILFIDVNNNGEGTGN